MRTSWRSVLAQLTPSAVQSIYHSRRDRRGLSQAAQLLAPHAKLHLASGTNILEGWANIDLAESTQVIRWDLTRPLPVPSDSIRFIFSEHFIEHLSPESAARLLRESYRVLQRGGVLRISTPSLERLVDEYRARRLSEWADVGWTPSTPCQMINEGMRLWGHQFLYDASELESKLKECGFREIARVEWHNSSHPELEGLECRPFHGDLIVEGTK
jgi:predicted SAM-dependent methyltransferase